MRQINEAFSSQQRNAPAMLAAARTCTLSHDRKRNDQGHLDGISRGEPIGTPPY